MRIQITEVWISDFLQYFGQSASLLSEVTSVAVYRIVENFQGRKLSWISRFCSYSQKFFLQNWGRSIFWQRHINQQAICESCISAKSRKFSPSKVFRYTVVIAAPSLACRLFLHQVGPGTCAYWMLSHFPPGEEPSAKLFLLKLYNFTSLYLRSKNLFEQVFCEMLWALLGYTSHRSVP